MTRQFSLLAAFTLAAGSALSLGNSSSAQTMSIAWDCFDRTTNALVARSAIDITSPAISCLQAAGSGGQQSQPPVDDGLSSDPGSDSGVSQEHSPDVDGFGLADDETTEPEPTSDTSTGNALGHALGNHLGKLLGQGIADLFGRRR
jgi:hypothetical protein